MRQSTELLLNLGVVPVVEQLLPPSIGLGWCFEWADFDVDQPVERFAARRNRVAPAPERADQHICVFFLADLWENIPAGTNSVPNEGTLANSIFLQQLAPLRAANAWLPGPPTGTNTNVKLYRVFATGNAVSAVAFTAGQ